MCGRYTLRTALNKLLAQFAIECAEADFEPRYNIAPTQQVAVVRQTPDGRRELVSLRWGFEMLVPGRPDGNHLINARSETAASKPAFRTAFRERRCLILADGFYEWRTVGRRKQPFFIQRADSQPFAFAGLWDRALQNSATSDVCTILTTSASELLQPLHERMPVILDPIDYNTWLDPGNKDTHGLQALMRLYPSSALTLFSVSPRVNSAAVDDPACIEPASVKESLERQRSLFD